MKEQIIGGDLFSGVGGLSLGAEMAGIKVKYAIEMGPFAAETYKANHPLTSVIQADVRSITALPCTSSNNQLVLFGGAPCQRFSTSNRRTNTRSNPGNWLYKEFIRMIHILNPQWVVFENVTGLLEMESGAFLTVFSLIFKVQDTHVPTLY